MALGELLYETADIAYDTVSKNYVNPKDNSVYGVNPPASGWAINWYMDTKTSKPIVVSGTQTAEQITQQLANVTTTSDSMMPSFWKGKTFGIDNTLLVVGVVGVGAMLFLGKGGR